VAAPNTTSTLAPATTIPPTTLAPATTLPTTTTPPQLTRLAGEPAVGSAFHGLWSNYTPAVRQTVLDDLAAAHVAWVRIDIGWINLEPNGSGQIDAEFVARADAVINEARARGLMVLATLWASPPWANGGQSTKVPPSNPADYARIAQWAAAHFQGRIAAWEFWNEPNIDDYWIGHDPAAYANLVRAAYPAVKAGDPNALVVIAGPSYNDTDYLSALYDHGVHGFFDVISTHPYQGHSNSPPETADDGSEYTLTHVAAVHQLMVARGDGAKPIWFTEYGWSSHPNTSATPYWQMGVTEQQQGDYLIRTLRWVAQNAPYVTNAFWYNDLDTQFGDVHGDNYGLLRTNLSPKPAYTALKSYLTGLAG
jgi:hypothetical protein